MNQDIKKQHNCFKQKTNGGSVSVHNYAKKRVQQNFEPQNYQIGQYVFKGQQNRHSERRRDIFALDSTKNLSKFEDVEKQFGASPQNSIKGATILKATNAQNLPHSSLTFTNGESVLKVAPGISSTVGLQSLRDLRQFSKKPSSSHSAVARMSGKQHFFNNTKGAAGTRALGDRFNPNTKLQEYVDSDKIILKNRRKSKGSNGEAHKFNLAVWQYKDVVKKTTGGTDPDKTTAEDADSILCENDQGVGRNNQSFTSHLNTASNQLTKKHSRVVFTEKDILRSSINTNATKIEKACPSQKKYGVSGKQQTYDASQQIQKVQQFFKNEEERKKRREEEVFLGSASGHAEEKGDRQERGANVRNAIETSSISDPDMKNKVIDYYLKQSENYSYVSKDLGKFEKGLIEHVKKIRDGSVLLNPDKGYVNSDQENGLEQLLLNKDRFESVFNQKIKTNFKVDSRCQEEARRLFEMVRTKSSKDGEPLKNLLSKDGLKAEVFIKKRDLKLFIQQLREASNQKILANKTFTMLTRLEKAIPPTQPVRFSEFLNFICQPNKVVYAQQAKEIEAAGKQGNLKTNKQTGKYQLTKNDVDQLWTDEDQQFLAKAMKKQEENRVYLQKLEQKFDELNSKCHDQLTITLKTLQAENSIEAQQTLADFRRKEAEEKYSKQKEQKQREIASRVLGAPDATYFNGVGKQNKGLGSSKSDFPVNNPFISQKDFKNITSLLAKLNQTVSKLSTFQEKSAGKLSDIQIIQKKIKQFGEAIGIVQTEISKKHRKEIDDLELKKLKKFEASGPNTLVEKQFVEAQSAETYQNLVEINQIIRRRGIIKNIDIGLKKGQLEDLVSKMDMTGDGQLKYLHNDSPQKDPDSPDKVVEVGIDGSIVLKSQVQKTSDFTSCRNSDIYSVVRDPSVKALDDENDQKSVLNGQDMQNPPIIDAQKKKVNVSYKHEYSNCQFVVTAIHPDFPQIALDNKPSECDREEELIRTDGEEASDMDEERAAINIRRQIMRVSTTNIQDRQHKLTTGYKSKNNTKPNIESQNRGSFNRGSNLDVQSVLSERGLEFQTNQQPQNQSKISNQGTGIRSQQLDPQYQVIDNTIDDYNNQEAVAGRQTRQDEAMAISQKYQEKIAKQYEPSLPPVDFVGKLEDAKGELWAFTAKKDHEKRQHGFDVYNWKVDELLEGGCLQWMGHVGNEFILITQGKPHDENSGEQMVTSQNTQPSRSQIYTLPLGSHSLQHPSDSLQNIGVAQASSCILREQMHYLVLNQQGYLKMFKPNSSQVFELPASATSLIHKQFKFIGTGSSGGNLHILQGIENSEVLIIGNLLGQKTQSNTVITTPKIGNSRKNSPQKNTSQAQSPSGKNNKCDGYCSNSNHYTSNYFTKIDRIRFQMKIVSLAVGSNHVLALSELRQGGKVFSWGQGHSGQLGHGNTDDLTYPKHIKDLATYQTQIEAVGDTSLVLDELNQLRTFGSNDQGLLGDSSDEEYRCQPLKLGKQFLLQQILFLRSGSLSRSNQKPLCCFSFLNEIGELYIWGSFGIPLKGFYQIPEVSANQQQPPSPFSSIMTTSGQSGGAMSLTHKPNGGINGGNINFTSTLRNGYTNPAHAATVGHTGNQKAGGLVPRSMMDVLKTQLSRKESSHPQQQQQQSQMHPSQAAPPHQRGDITDQYTISNSVPKKANFFFDPCLKMKVKDYRISFNQIAVIAEHSGS